MKKYFFYMFFVLSLIVLTGYGLNVYAQDENDQDQEETYEEENNESEATDLAPLKMLFFDLGFGASKLSTGLGFRYWHFGASIGLTGFSNTVPGFDRTYYQKPTGSTVEERFSSLAVAGDLYYFQDFNKFTAFANVGYYSQSDTVLYKELNTGNYYFKEKISDSGMTYGAGLQYLLSKWIAVGLGYHSKLGVTAQIGYRWN